ncbi:MAG: Flp pilus assembly protein RcpC/CpaB [Pseudomonadota bacterium]
MALARNSKMNRGRRGRSARDPRALLAPAGFGIAFLIVVGLVLHASRAPSDAGVSKEVALVPLAGVEIIVPIETLQVGTSFQPNMFRKEQRPEEQVSGDTVRSFDELKGMYAKGVLVKNQPVLKGVLTNRQPVHILTAALPKKYRAVALQVEQPLLDNVDGWAQPGTDVDLLWLTSAFGRETISVLAGPVRVLASNKATEGTPQQAASSSNLVTVTLLLSIRDSIRVSLAAMHGKVSLGLRGQNDRRPNESSRPISSVLDESVPVEMEKPSVKVKVVDVASKTSEIMKFSPDGRRIEEPHVP